MKALRIVKWFKSIAIFVIILASSSTELFGAILPLEKCPRAEDIAKSLNQLMTQRGSMAKSITGLGLVLPSGQWVVGHIEGKLGRPIQADDFGPIKINPRYLYDNASLKALNEEKKDICGYYQPTSSAFVYIYSTSQALTAPVTLE